MQVLNFVILKMVQSLIGKQPPIDHKQDPPEPVRLDQPVCQSNNGTCFTRSGRHGQQNPFNLGFFHDGLLNPGDRFHLIIPERKAVFILEKIGLGVFQRLIGFVNVLLPKLFQPFSESHPFNDLE